MQLLEDEKVTITLPYTIPSGSKYHQRRGVMHSVLPPPSSCLQINTKFRTSLVREVLWPLGRALLFLPHTGRNELSSSSVCSHTHPVQMTMSKKMSRVTRAWKFGAGFNPSRQREGWPCIIQLSQNDGVWLFQQPYFKRSRQGRCWASLGSPHLLPLEPRTEKCPVAQSQVEICTSYSVLSNLCRSRWYTGMFISI